MNCRDIESLILAEPDGALSKEQHAALSAHVATCPACTTLRNELKQAESRYRQHIAAVPVPDADHQWREIQARMRPTPGKRRPLAPVIWFAAPLAAAAAVAFAFLVDQPAATPPAPVVATSQALPENVGPAAPTISYVDNDSGWLVVWTTEPSAQVSG